VSYADYDLNPLNLALDLASLGEGALSFGEVVREQAMMFSDHGYQPGDQDTQVTLTRLGAELAAVLSQDGDEFIDALSLLLAAYDCRPRLTRHDGVPHLHYARDDAPAAEWMSSMAVSQRPGAAAPVRGGRVRTVAGGHDSQRVAALLLRYVCQPDDGRGLPRPPGHGRLTGGRAGWRALRQGAVMNAQVTFPPKSASG
jgi:hypothetical protein